MAERPILMNAEKVRAVLAGTKTQTRRPIKPHRGDDEFVLVDENSDGSWWPWRSDDGESQMLSDGTEHRFDFPFGKPGDTLWVRETFMHEPADYCWEASVSIPSRPASTAYRADFPASKAGEGWTPSIHMPRSLSRITLEITDIRVERLQSINEEDAMAEGVERDSDGWRDYLMPHTQCCNTARASFLTLIESIYPGAWDRNEWQWVISFRRIDARNKVTTS